jgi:hypothetical protein
MCNCCYRLARCKSHLLNDAGCNERRERICCCCPEAGDEQADGGDQVNGSLAIFDCQTVAHDTADSNGTDQPSLEAGDELVERYVELCRQWHEC